MICKKKQEQVKKICDYIMENDTIYDKLVIFGECLEEVTDDVFLDVAVKTVKDEDATSEDILFDLVSTIDDITEGRFNLIVINDPDVTTNILHNIEKGVVVYDTTI